MAEALFIDMTEMEAESSRRRLGEGDSYARHLPSRY